LEILFFLRTPLGVIRTFQLICREIERQVPATVSAKPVFFSGKKVI
jgi:hypothetical protein